MSLNEMVDYYLKNGYQVVDAFAKVAQDVVLYKISNSVFSKNVTLKGGVIMHNLSDDKRRATRDIDLDLIRYSLSDDSIRQFIDKLNLVKDGVFITINGEIKKLHHQDYDGKRVYISLIDSFNYRIDTKLDIGVHKNLDIKQEEYCFNFDVINKSVTLLANSKEQMFVEKLKSLLKFSITSTRYKDIYDFYYLIVYCKLNEELLRVYLKKIIFDDVSIKANDFSELYLKLKIIFNDENYIFQLQKTKDNWLDANLNDVLDTILNYFENFI